MNDVLKIIERHRRDGDHAATVAVMAKELGVVPETIHAWRKRGLVAIGSKPVMVEWTALGRWFESLRDKAPENRRVNNRAAKKILRERFGMKCG